MPTLTLTFSSDWRIGSGTGRPGDVDQLIRRDRNQAPFLPAKTIIGIWRDSCEQVAHALDDGQPPTEDPPTWQSWVTYLFGNQPNRRGTPQDLIPAGAHLQVGSAHLDDKLLTAFANKPALQAALTFVKPGVKINRRSGTAKDKHFRLEEMARGGISLTATVQLAETNTHEPLNTTQLEAAYALLVAGATLTERIGGKRRRGAGRCSLSLSHLPDSIFSTGTYDSHLAKAPPALPQPLKETGAIEAGTPDSDPQNDAPQNNDPQKIIAATKGDTTRENWHRFSIAVTTQQPIIISKGTIGNVVETLDYIPGSKLLPIITRHLRSLGVKKIGDAIAHSQLIITNALPTQTRTSTHPTPFSLFEEKNQPLNATTVPAINKLVAEPDNNNNLDNTKQRKQLRRGYISVQSTDSERSDAPTKVLLTTVDTAIETHNTVEDSQQRPTSEVGGVYSYESIPAGTRLQGELRLHADVLTDIQSSTQKEDWYTTLTPQQNIGISKKDEYGQVSIVLAPCADKSEQQTQASSASKALTVWLLSDLLLRDPWLRPTTNTQDLCGAIAQALQLPTTALSLMDYEPDKNASLLVRQRRSESWQTRWELPRPSLVGFSAGSCFRFSLNSDAPTAAAIQQLETVGLGERRVEGYGQLKINSPLLAASEITVVKKIDIASPVSSKTIPPETKPLPYNAKDNVAVYARQIEKVAWRSAIQRAAATLAGVSQHRETLLGLTLNKKGDSIPKLSQLGGVRSQLATLKTDADKDIIISWIDANLKKDKAPTETLTKVKAFLNKKDPLDPTKDKPNNIWEILDFEKTLALGEDQLCCTDSGKDKLKASLRLEAIEVFISECIRAQTRESEALKKTAQKETQENPSKEAA